MPQHGDIGGTPFDPDTYRRLIELFDLNGTTKLATLCDLDNSDNAENFVEHCEFELLRQGGCGSGQITLSKAFEYPELELGQWIKCSYSAGDAWYFGRIEDIDWNSPSGISINLYGPMSLLSNILIGGSGGEFSPSQGVPEVWARSDYFLNDPDRSTQEFETVSFWWEIADQIYNQYIVPRTNIGKDTIQQPPLEDGVFSTIFRGGVSITQALRQIALSSYGSSYGVNADNDFFFIPKNSGGWPNSSSQADVLFTFQDGLDLSKVKKRQDTSLLVNVIHLVGGTVYGISPVFDVGPEVPGFAQITLNPGFFTFRAVVKDAASIGIYGEHMTEIYIPWIRTVQDALWFGERFFERYARPTTRFQVTTLPQSVLVKPWEGDLKIRDKDGNDVFVDEFHRVQVVFDEAPFFTLYGGAEELQFPTVPIPFDFPLKGQGGDNGDQGGVFSESISGMDSSGACVFCEGIRVPEVQCTYPVTRIFCAGLRDGVFHAGMNCGEVPFEEGEPCDCPIGCHEVVIDVRCSDDELVVEKECARACE